MILKDSKLHEEAADGAPRPEAMLLALLCRDVADNLAPSRKENRDNAVEALGLKDKTRDEQDRVLDSDPGYQKTRCCGAC